MAQRTPSGLLAAVQKGQKHDVLRLIKRKISVSESDSDGFTCVMEAAANNHITILSALIEAKADISPVNRIGRTALIEAACRGHPAITLRLCQARPDLDYANQEHPLGLTALMEAASRGHDGVAFWLCEARADINKTNKWGDTALILAANNNRLRSVQTLVAQRALLDIRGDGGLTALETARVQGHTRIVDFLSDPRIRSADFCNDLYARMKAFQKDVLQDEVNYDASTSSRVVRQAGSVPSVYPPWEQVMVPVAIDTTGDSIASSLSMSLRLSGSSTASSSSGSMLLSLSAASSSASTISTASTISAHSSLASTASSPSSSSSSLSISPLSTTRSISNKGPLALLPKFGTCTWVAIEPTRHVKLSRKEKAAQYNAILSDPTSSYPVLRVRDNGTWTYTGDVLSGNLEGTFELFNLLTSFTTPATAHLLSLGRSISSGASVNTSPSSPISSLNFAQMDTGSPVDSGLLSPATSSTSIATRSTIAGSISGSSSTVSSTSPSPMSTTSSIDNDPLKISSSPPAPVPAYYIRLTTTPPADTSSSSSPSSSRSSVPVQVVGFTLGRQIVLGRLVMEMADNVEPWWT